MHVSLPTGTVLLSPRSDPALDPRHPVAVLKRRQEQRQAARRTREPGEVEAGTRFQLLRRSLASLLILCGLLAAGTYAGRGLRGLRVERAMRRAQAARVEAERAGTLPQILAAVRRADEVLALDPAHGEALALRAYLLGQAAYELHGSAEGDLDSLLGEAARAARLVEGDGRPLARAALAYQALLSLDPALAAERARALVARGAAQAEPGLSEYLLAQAELLLGDHAAAAARIGDALARAPGHALWRARGATLLGEGRAPAGEPVSRSEKVEALLARAEQLARSASPEAAGAPLGQALALCPPFDLMTRERAVRLLLGIGALPQAHEQARQLFQDAPFREPARLLFARVLLAQHLAAEVVGLLAPVTERAEARAEALLLQAEAFLQLEDPGAALPVLRRMQRMSLRTLSADQIRLFRRLLAKAEATR